MLDLQCPACGVTLESGTCPLCGAAYMATCLACGNSRAFEQVIDHGTPIIKCTSCENTSDFEVVGVESPWGPLNHDDDPHLIS